jgi:hypothetical protein
MAQTGKPGAERALDNAQDRVEDAAERGKRTVDHATDVARAANDRTGDAARYGLHVVQRAAGAVGEVQREVTQRSAEGMAELGRALVDLTVAQTRQNLETWTALTGAVDWEQVAKAVDWDRVFQIQSEFLRVSLERTVQLTQHYLEVTQTVVTTAASAAQRQAEPAA